jgi:ribonuclease HI
LDAKLGTKPSFAWRSIYGARDLIVEGMIWRVGDGDSIRIWGDKWLPKPSTFAVYSAPKVLEPDAKVKELINENSGWWNQNLLNSIFSKEEVEAINTIPISSTQQPDIQVWRGTNSGIFSVRSAYHLSKELEQRDQPGSSSTEEVSEVWRTLWSLPIQNAEKNFMWRACRNLLPTKENLLQRKVVSEPLCPICGRETETVFHILWDCPSARDVWGASERCFQKCSFTGPNFIQVAEGILSRWGSDALAAFIILARKIWFRRNSVVHGGLFSHPNHLVQEMRNSVEEYKQIRIEEDNKRARLHEPTQPNTIKWEPPPIGWYKANWDAAFAKDTGILGVGIIVRNCRGDVVAAKSFTHMGRLEPTVGEAKAAYYAAMMCREHALTPVILEGDAQNVVTAVRSNECNWSRISHLAADIRTIMEPNMVWQCIYVNRIANMAAHRLAKMATYDIIDRCWNLTYPDCIRDVILMEQVHPSSD